MSRFWPYRELKTTFPQAGKATGPNPADGYDWVIALVADTGSMGLRAGQTHKVVEKSQREDLKILEGLITETIKYAKNRSNVHGPIKTGLANALKELRKIEKKGMALLKVPELRLGGESMGPRTNSMDSLANSEATVDEVRTAIGKALKNQDDSRKVTLLKLHLSGLRMAIVVLAKGQANNLLIIGHVRAVLTKPSCFLCKDAGIKENGCEHIAILGSYRVFRRALDTAKKGKMRLFEGCQDNAENKEEDKFDPESLTTLMDEGCMAMSNLKGEATKG
ncbi:hypothetical protein TSAR_007987 [Trichomalopsis sarcophagae]|uniref:Uncharacterized protein n=1 Tax=Trichomalopsis sarcophagae TaxID=543379 RepID=A0A232FNP8_9HYME|nr:hypothetical protein TSAR_007987 [Trichomalopsis sarcophagae]